MSPRSDEWYMRLAIAEARRGRALGEHPFGAVLVDPGGAVLASAYDTVELDDDRTSHAETMLVKKACGMRGRDLSGCVLYTTTEPCPMCFTTAWLAGVARIVFGTTMNEVRQHTGGAVEELFVPASLMNVQASRKVELVGGLLREECLALFGPSAERAGVGVGGSVGPA